MSGIMHEYNSASFEEAYKLYQANSGKCDCERHCVCIYGWPCSGCGKPVYSICVGMQDEAEYTDGVCLECFDGNVGKNYK